jgi:hypothetical protein
VRDQNGACVRLEGTNLELTNVYFHDSQQGLLTGPKPGKIIIRNSKFERLGKGGQAHGIYVGGGELSIYGSYFLSSKDEGHEIKSRASKNTIYSTVVASLEGNDSRLIDIPNGGVLIITDSILQQGANTSNSNLIGYGHEGYRYKENEVRLVGNIILNDRINGSKVIDIRSNKIKPYVSENAVIGKHFDKFDDSNFIFGTRNEAQMQPFPFLPELIR